MITLYCGSSPPPDQEFDFRLQDDADYIVVRRAIRDVLISGGDLRIYVSDPAIQHWFWDLEKYPDDFQVHERNPRRALEQKLGTLLPPLITDEGIEALELLNEETPAEPVEDVCQWIAAICLGPIWGEEQPGKDHLRGVIGWFIHQELAENHAILLDVIEERLRSWEKRSVGSFKDVYASLRIQQQETVQFLCAWDALSHYPSAMRKLWLEEQGWYSREREDLAGGLDGLPPNPDVDEEFRNLVKPFWKERLGRRFKETMNAGK